jgi:transcription-repair coupling factor (superfamily II helicase)
LAETHQKLLIVCESRQAAESLEDDLRFFLPGTPIAILPPWDTLPFEQVSPQIETSARRIAVLSLLWGATPAVVIASADSLIQRVLPPALLKVMSFTVTVGDTINRTILLERIDLAGFRRVSLVEEVGDYAVRGGVIDIFPATTTQPVRIECVGDGIDQVRTFDLDSQRSVGSLNKVEILPVRELLRLGPDSPFHELLPQALERLKDRGRNCETPAREIARAMHAIRTDTDYPALELLQPIALGGLPALHETIPPSAYLVIENSLQLEAEAEGSYRIIEDRALRARADGALVPEIQQLYATPEEVVRDLLARPHATLEQLEILPEAPNPLHERITIRTSSHQELVTKLKTKVGTGKALQPLKQAINQWRREKLRVALVVGTSQRAERLHRLLLDLTIDAPILAIPQPNTTEGAPPSPPRPVTAKEWQESAPRWPVAILLGHLSDGFQLPSEGVVYVSEHEVFSERSYRAGPSRRSPSKRLLNILNQLKEGDFIVHVDFGIGRYRGLKHIVVEEQGNDFLHVEYADSQLYLPVHQISKIQKFVANEGSAPELDKLGSQRWLKTKIKVRESVASLAGDLIKLYATRTVAKGWRFEPHGAEDERFADGFPYQETGDQMKAIEDTIADMAKDQPMDRLVCGDVGFGKTEVALRAAFKCTHHARQVAVLAPTTILVDQHRRNFEERFLGYPVKIGSVSRFYDAATNRRTLEQLASGQLDVIIGTHRLLQRDVQFRDLGLVIVDEEHRFGVKQKERLKQLKKQVDILTLTATPIPRTLHMALLGIRDISIISTPPTDRRVIRTYVAERNNSLIRDAIMRELQRGGQVFFLSNRITGMDILTEELQAIVPEARFVFGHGQMSEHQLEVVMKRFIAREADVLVSTTIIESGIDIPNANTIIIDRADTLGLAQLYQIRGRVGRSTKQAYAYLMVPHARKLGAEAQKRLRALQALDDLGLGFNLALADMEIRGAGNLLGKEQSGSVVAVGFELYTKILREAVMNLKGEEIALEETIDPEVKLPVEAFIPDLYIPDVSERLVIYQRLAGIGSDDDARELYEEMRDRFGPLDVSSENYIELMQLRAVLRRSGIARCEFGNGKLHFGLSPRAPIDLQQTMKLVKTKPERYSFSKNLTLSIILAPTERPSIQGVRTLIEQTLTQIRQ